MTTVRKLRTEATAPIWITFEVEHNSAGATVIRALQALNPALRQMGWAIVAAEFERNAEDALENYQNLECMQNTAEEFISRWKKAGMKTLGSQSFDTEVNEMPKKAPKVSSSPSASKANKAGAKIGK